MNLNLDGRVAFVTGAGGGIGFAIANALGEEGCKLIICDLNETAIDKAAEKLRNRNMDVYSGVLDVTEEEAYQVFAEKAYQHFGRIDFGSITWGCKSINHCPLSHWPNGIKC